MNVLHCQGFLDALALLNGEASDLCATYELQLLPPAPDLLAALGVRVEEHALSAFGPGRAAAAPLWQIKLAPFEREQLPALCQRWFFSSRHMQAAPPGRFRTSLVDAFLETLDVSLAGFTAHAVTMTPPLWYAINWNEIAYESGNERYLLHFSYSD